MLRTAHSYSCIMAPLWDITDGVHAVSAGIPDELIYDDDKGEMGRQDGIHVTVKYGLHTSDYEEVARELSKWPPFDITIGRTSVFHGEGDYVVLKLGVESRDLVRLNQFVSRTFECTDTHPDYKPHATIAYMVKNPKDPYYYQEFYTDEFAGQVVPVTELEFSPAEGEKQMIPLLGTSDGLQARQILDLARDVLGGGSTNAI